MKPRDKAYRKIGERRVTRMEQALADLLDSSRHLPWLEVRDRLNRKLKGWSAYFHHGTRLMAYRAINNCVYQGVRHFLRRRHKVESRGTARFTRQVVFGEWGVYQLRGDHLGPHPRALG